jgi:hypothetical protein
VKFARIASLSGGPDHCAQGAAVPEVDDARAEGARLDELERDSLVAGEEGFATAEGDGVDEESVLVDEAVCGQARG